MPAGALPSASRALRVLARGEGRCGSSLLARSRGRAVACKSASVAASLARQESPSRSSPRVQDGLRSVRAQSDVLTSSPLISSTRPDPHSPGLPLASIPTRLARYRLDSHPPRAIRLSLGAPHHHSIAARKWARAAHELAPGQVRELVPGRVDVGHIPT